MRPDGREAAQEQEGDGGSGMRIGLLVALMVLSVIAQASAGPCEIERPSINKRCVMFICLCFGGLLIAFGPGVSLDHKRRILRASLVVLGLGCCEFGLLFWFMVWVYPYTWGLPPQWLPAQWNPCPQSQYRSTVPHVDRKPNTFYPDL